MYLNMGITNSLNLVSTFLLLILSIPSLTSSSIETFVFANCTQQKYSQGSPYESNVNSLLTSLVNSAKYSSYNNCTIMGSNPEDVVYGLYQCRGDLSMPNCATCVARAVSQLCGLCSHTCGGALQLQGCYVKYDNANFLSVEYKTFVSKRCGPSVCCDTDGMASRDAVLLDLTRASGLYKTSCSGNIEGVAQCNGDLSVGECQDCLSEAVERLKSDCGTGVYGDMFLAKCYARYSTDDGKDRYNSNYNNKNENSSSNKGEKTFRMIIIVLLAGVALLIVLVIFAGRVSIVCVWKKICFKKSTCSDCDCD